ncbi:MAG: UPF0182 family protein [Chitinispirillaceae bacterium]
MLFFLLSVVILVLAAIPLTKAIFGKEQPGKDQIKRAYRGGIILGAGIVLLTAFWFLLQFLTDYYWFSQLDYSKRFLTVLWSRLILYAGGAAFAGIFLYINYAMIRKGLGYRKNGYGIYAIIAAALILGFWPANLWNEILLLINQVRSPVEDPIFNQSVSFYLFSLPIYSAIVGWAVVVLFASYAVVTAVIAVKYSQQENLYWLRGNRKVVGHYLFLTGLFSLVLAGYFLLQVFYLLYSNDTAVIGVGYTDFHVTIYGFYAVAGAFLIAAVLFFAGIFSHSLQKRVFFLSHTGSPTGKSFILPGAILGVMALGLWLVPFLMQNLAVSPNEITLEKPFLQNNIEFTRLGYNISQERVEESLYPVGDEITTSVVEDNESTLDNVRLWDWRALVENLRQQQEIRLYYAFNDADIDRYHQNGEYRQMMVSVRELDKTNLDPRSRNWVSLKLKYTHGFGAVMVPANDILPTGGPNMVIKNIPPESDLENIQITQPRIYYGELTNDQVYVKTTESEFDYPQGDQIVTNFYDGEGGVWMGSLWRRFLYALRFDDYRLLISGYFTDESRVMFRRNIVERAQTLLPFLQLDRDPYPVITDQGRIVWIIDAYTTSSMYPYSQRYQGLLPQFSGNNYIRNSVKIVVDAFHGTVEPYVIDTSDVIISSYQKIFPGLFRSFEQMSQNLKRHIRYPADYFTIQSEIYTAYHMVNTETFYQREDLWEFATERYREQFQLVTPYYVMMEFPGSDSVEFALINPFTPRNRNVMNGWMAGRSDVPNYGKLTVYPIPKGQQVFGPRQIESRIDQNSIMSQAITLWSQQGSEVIRGNLLVIPLFYSDTLHMMYVEPLYVQAQDARLPEVRRVIVADQARVLWAEMFDSAIEALAQQVEALPEEAPEPGVAPQEAIDVERARALLQELRNLAAEGRFAAAGERLEELSGLLEDAGQ